MPKPFNSKQQLDKGRISLKYIVEIFKIIFSIQTFNFEDSEPRIRTPKLKSLVFKTEIEYKLNIIIHIKVDSQILICVPRLLFRSRLYFNENIVEQY